MHHKKLIAAMVAVGVSMPALAVADMTLYGRAHLSADILDDGADYNEFNVSSNSSRLGFKGERQFADDLTAIFQIEQQIDFDDSGTEFATRDTFGGLKGDWGMLRVGKFDTPFKRARGPANFFGDQVGDMRNLTRTNDHGRFDERFKNSIHYRSPSFNGLVGDIQYSVDNSGQSTAEDAENRAVSTSLSFRNGPVNVVAAYENQSIYRAEGSQSSFVVEPDGNVTSVTSDVEGFDYDAEAWRLAGSYQITPVFRLGALYQVTESTRGVEDQEGKVYGLGGQYKASPNVYLNAHWFTLDSDLDDNDASLYAIGLEYRMDSALRFYGNIAVTDNDDNSSLTSWSAARSAGPGGAAGEKATAFSLGMRYDF
ncbi:MULTISPECIES: porin [unclassified Ectothiorhodospira]|uniref:porin n=1 Tax=unclassified Ectothiorhodospira TaxID=2684909 RepID=UPI001EE88CBC|nr:MULTISPECIES: porin [unclassified Ectothiorhodospira]MCG5516992.1 porin [Ectothiorhodospira sp. 9100]MCG5519199.1 porin [Ectothiorhodospira sp. 9905]